MTDATQLSIFGDSAVRTVKEALHTMRVRRLDSIFTRRGSFGYCSHPLCGGNRIVVRFKKTTPVCRKHWRMRRALAAIDKAVQDHPELRIAVARGAKRAFIAVIVEQDGDGYDEIDLWAHSADEAMAQAQVELCMFDERCIVQRVREASF